MNMLSKDKKYHFTYQTKNLVNDKTYIGVHSTNNINDGYLGSGDKLAFSIKKYGNENFKIEILCFFNTKEEAFPRTKQQLEKIKATRIKNGGYIVSDEHREKLRITSTGRVFSAESIKKQKATRKKNHPYRIVVFDIKTNKKLAEFTCCEDASKFTEQEVNAVRRRTRGSVPYQNTDKYRYERIWRQ